jgi:hypothetical protein
MSVKNITYLKSKFQTGDHPTQTDYYDWLDTMFYGTQSSLQQILQGGNTASNSICLSTSAPSAYAAFCTKYTNYSGYSSQTTIAPNSIGLISHSGNLILSSLGTSTTNNQYFQDASGTIALLSDIGTFSGSGVNFSGTTSNGVLTYLTGSTVSVQSSMTYDGSTLNLGASSSTGVIINVQGSSGQLFTVSDGLTGSLFGVSDISGIPLFTVNSNGAVYPSSFNSSNIYATQSLISIDKTSGKSAFIDYVVDNTTGFRSGTILSVWNGTNLVSNDTSVSIGTTTGITLSATISGAYFKVYANVTSGTWSVKMGIRVL